MLRSEIAKKAWRTRKARKQQKHQHQIKPESRQRNEKLDVEECRYLQENGLCDRFRDKDVICGIMSLGDCKLAEKI